MNYTAETYSNINPALFYGGGFCGGVDPRREQYAGEDVAGVEVPDYKTKYEALQNVIKDNYQLFEVDYYGVDNDNYVDGAGFCCEPKAQAKNARSLPTENVDYEKLQYYYHSDHLGSASYITNLDGEVVQHIEYVPFGEVFLEERNNTWNTPFLFNGKELDEETGLYYYGARYYNPRVSLWYGVDPLFEKYPNESPYCYVGNNPVVYFDPDGRKKIKLEGSFLMTSGKIGVKIADGLALTLMGGYENKISLSIHYDTENKKLGIGVSINYVQEEGYEMTFGLMGGGESEIKESVLEGSIGFDFEKNLFFAEGKDTLLEEDEYDQAVVSFLGIFSKIIKDTKGKKDEVIYKAGASGEVHLGIIGTGLGASLSIEDSPQKDTEE